jgi:hypothetical protein
MHRRQPRQRGGKLLARTLGADRRVDPVGERLGHRVTSGTGERPVLLNLRPAVAADQVSGDSVQPRPGAAVFEVVSAPLAERRQERLRHHVVGRTGADAAAHIPLHLWGVPAEQHREVLGLIPGALDHRRVVLGVTSGGAGPHIGPLALPSRHRRTLRVSSDTRSCQERAHRFPPPYSQPLMPGE